MEIIGNSVFFITTIYNTVYCIQFSNNETAFEISKWLSLINLFSSWNLLLERKALNHKKVFVFLNVFLSHAKINNLPWHSHHMHFSLTWHISLPTIDAIICWSLNPSRNFDVHQLLTDSLHSKTAWLITDITLPAF